MLISVEPIFARLDETSTSENAASDRRRKRSENVEPPEHGGVPLMIDVTESAISVDPVKNK